MHIPAQEPSLTFEWLHQRMAAYATTERHVPSRLERWSLVIGLFATLAGLSVAAASAWWPIKAMEVATKFCLVVEVVAFALYLFMNVRRELPQFTRPRESHAVELDGDFARWQRFVADLRRFSSTERAARLRYVTALRDRMVDRMGLLLGGVQRLGVLPLLVAFYLQFRSWQWGDWSAAFKVNPLVGLLIVAMVGLYLGGWLLVSLRARLDLYVNLLEESLESPGHVTSQSGRAG